MPSKYEIVSEMAAQQARGIVSSGAGRYMAFLETAANNYKYNFREQVLIHAQKPSATACAEIDTWNRLGRWVNKGTKGIALLVDHSPKYKLRYVFDISDTNSRAGYTVTLWRFQPRYADSVLEALENSFGALENHAGFASDLIGIAEQVVEDNYSDYADMLRSVKAGSFLEELDDLNIEVWLKSTLKSSVAFMLLTRCGYNAREYMSAEDFSHIYDFNTLNTVSVLGDATSDIAEMVLREIEVTVRALQKEEKRQNRTFANPVRARDNVRTNDERSAEHGTDLSAGGRLSAAQRSTPGESEGGQVWDAAARFPARPQETDLHRDAPEREPEQPLGGDRPAGNGDGRAPDGADGEVGERDGEPESLESDAVGAEDEQYPEPSRGDGADGADLQLIDIEAAIHGGVAYYHHDAEKQELIRTCAELKDHRVEIAAYFDAHEDKKERGDFIRSFFGNAYVEQILENGQRAGYRAYANCITLWRGAYLSREFESFMRWPSVADTIYGMMLMQIWLDPDEQPLPTVAEQMSLIAEEQAEKSSDLAIPQDAIDYVLRGGGGTMVGWKYRIYEQFQKGESPEDNIKFLKAEYGTGGHSDAIPGTGIFEDHDGTGMKFWRGGREKGTYESVLIKWPKIEKRIRQLIAADTYLSRADKETGYPAFQHSREVREQRGALAQELRSIVDEFNTHMDERGETDKKLNQYELSMCASDFMVGSKRTIARSFKGDFVLVLMREAMQTVMAEDESLRERCESVLETLTGPLAMAMEPTEEELNPPPEPKKEYSISLGDTVYLGSKAYDVLSLGDEEVMLSDRDYPLFTENFKRADFDRMIAENPMNDHLLREVAEEDKAEEAPKAETKKYELGYGYMGNGLTVWNRLEKEHGDYKTVAHIDNDRTVTFYEEDMPESVKDAIRKVAATDTTTLTSPLPTEEKPSQAQGNELWQNYSRVKAEHEGTIVMYQVGDFYEVLGDDAKKVAEALDIGLTTRNVGLKERIAMCGIPVKAGDTPLQMLLDRGMDVFLVDDEGGTYSLPSYHKDAPAESRPVGRIDYLGSNGEVGYSSEYTSESQFLRDIEDDNHNGVPMSIVVYRDKDGNTLPLDFVEHLDPPPQGFKVADYAVERAETSLDRAKKLIDEYCESEFQSTGDYEDLQRVGIGHTTITDDEMPVQIYADLINCRIDRYIFDQLIERREYDSLEDLISSELANLDFMELIYFTDGQLERARSYDNASKDARFHVVEVVRFNEPTFYSVWDDEADAYYVDNGFVEEFSSEWQAEQYCQQLNDGGIPEYAIGDIIQIGNDDDVPEYRIIKTKTTAYNEQGIPITMYGFEAYWDKELQHLKFSNTDVIRHSEPIKIIGHVGKQRGQDSSSRVDEMLQQAMLASEMAEQTGQMVFGFEEGNPLPVNAPPTESVVPSAQEPAETEIAPPPPPVRQSGKVAPSVLYPEIPKEERHDYHITDDRIGVGTPSERYAHNVAAIRLLKRLEEEHRLATPEEQEVLAQYVGWGGLADCFDERNHNYLELKSLLTEDEYAAARESTLTAFYTPPVVVRAIYQALENMGFKSGNVLEPSCGIGNFIGMKPDDLADTRIYGVELDSISGRIAQQLHQNSSIAVQGFEKTELPDSFFDVALGNIPFGNFKLSDKRYDKYGFLIHDYFFAKTLDKVRPGGIVAYVTSKGTMDKESPVVRKYLAQRADLLGAIRLPNNAFKDAAGTDVTSDILFFQKRDTLTVEEPAWVHLNTDANGLKMNQYFIDNPDMVMGEMREISGPFGPETACVAYDGQDLEEMLSDAIQNINGSITEYDFEEVAEEEEDKSIPADPSVRNFSYTLVDGAVYYRENSRMFPVDLSVTATSRVKGLIAIRDSVRKLIEYQTEEYADTMIAAEQKHLNELYDEFSKKYGIINSRANKSAFGTDNSYFLLSSLEVLDDEGNFVRKADMFYKRTIKQRTEITHVDTAAEALAVSLAEKAKVDIDYMAELTGKTEEELFSDLKGVIFLNPMFGYGSSSEAKYLPADEYLSGNVREKLSWARRSAELDPDDYTPNVEALERVQPVDLTAAEISVRLGSTWVPTEVYEEFMYELLDTPWYAQRNIKIHFSSYTGEWNVEGKSYDRSNVKAYNTYGTDRINGYKIIEQTLNLKDVRIFDYVEDENGRKVPVLNKKETAIAQAKQEQIKQAFQDWIWRDQGRRERLCKLYNEKFNSTRPREYDGSHLSLFGINPEITLRQHQLNAVARGLYGGNELLGHVVGAGKTFTMVAIAQESKRLGLCHKSLIVVPNHLTEQWASEYLQLYPSANILVATAKDFEAKNRKRFCGRIATGEYDAIIIGHSQLEKIPLSFGRQVYYLEQQREEIMDGIIELKANKGERFSIKQLERSKKQIEAKLEKLNDQSRKDDLVTFEELGIDKLFIDEAHYYKNLAAFTKMRNVGGISQTEAQKSSDLYMKIRYLDELTGGHGVCFATGTPISNTMVEMYTMQKYLQYETLRRNDLIHFDSWASTFGETVTAIELAPEGTGYRAKTRFAKFFNLPELIAMFAEVADIQTADMLKLPVPKANYHSVVLKPSELQKEMVADLAKRAERVRSGMVNSSEDNMLVITNDGRKLALDQRLMNEMLPENDTGKVAACAQNVFEIWQRTADKRSTQMVFCDLSTPHNDGKFNVYDALRDKLIAMGIPAEEIAYIHSASTEVKKKELFGKVRSGQIRVLLGSTQKMGAGTNVQAKLIALHHLDCPWRPADLQQREGRIVRQGNENPEVEIYTYVTEGTFDAYLYQLVESKQKFIGQIMTSKSPVRSAEDIDETALSYAEIKALCSGNPKIKEKMDLDVAVAKLKLLKANHLSQIYSLESDITNHYPKKIKEAEQMVEAFHKDIARRDEQTHPNEDGFSPMIVEGKEHTEKKAAGSAILEACKAMTSPDAIPLGQYRGFDMELFFDTFSKEYRVTLVGALRQTVSLGMDLYGNIQRLDNALDGMESRLQGKEADLTRLREQLETAKVEAQRPFPQEDALKEKQARLDELNIELNMDKRENEVVDDERDDGESDTRGERDHER